MSGSRKRHKRREMRGGGVKEGNKTRSRGVETYKTKVGGDEMRSVGRKRI